MTNRLPVVGKKYRNKNGEVFLAKFKISDDLVILTNENDPEDLRYFTENGKWNGNIEVIIVDENIKEATTLTDFVNAFQQMQEELKKMKEEPVNPSQIIMDYMQEEIKLRQKTYAMLKEKYPELLKNYNLK